MRHTKKLSGNGSITIPKDVRTHLGLTKGSALDVTAMEDGSIRLRWHVDQCRFCGAQSGVVRYRDICICPACATDLAKVVEV